MNATGGDMAGRRCAIAAGDGRRAQSRRTVVWFASSASLIAIAASTGLHAQTLPTGCVSDGADPTMAADGDTVTCLPPPTPIDSIFTTASDLTINIGSAATAAEVNDSGIAVNMSSPGVQTLNILNADSVVSGSSIGVRMRAVGGSLDRIINSEGTISGGADGIEVFAGAQSVDIDARDVTGVTRYGVNLLTISSSTDVSITSSGSVLGGDTGIRITPDRGSGALTLDVNNVTGTSGDAIFIEKSAGTDILINASGDIIGGNHGIYAANTSSDVGAFRVDATDVTGLLGHGVFASTGTAASELSITASGAIIAGLNGVDAQNNGTGAATIDLGAGGVIAAGVGVSAQNIAATTTDLVITSAGSISAASGIFAENDGTGALSITVADVTGATGDGVFARGSGAGVSLISTGTISGATNGISIANFGTGNLVVSTVGASGGSDDGIVALNGSGGADLDITATGTISGGDDGVSATNNGAGATTVNVADVSSVAGDGVRISNTAAGTDISLTAMGDIASGAFDGVDVDNNGTGMTSISVAAVSGGTDAGIEATNTSVAGAMSIAATGPVSGANEGVVATHLGAGALIIDVASVVGAAQDGIVATMSSVGETLSITASGTIEGGDEGVAAEHNGAGALVIDVADVTSGAGDGVRAVNSALGTDIIVSATGAIAAGAFDGLDIDNLGTGVVDITVTDVAGGSDAGIEVTNTAAAGAVSIVAAGLVSGANEGIDAVHSGAGMLTIDANDVVGTAEDGVFASVSALSDGLSVVARGDVVGADSGVRVANAGTGTTTINIAGSVAGTAAFGVLAQTANGAVIAIGDGASVSGATAAVSTSGFTAGEFINDIVSVGAGASITGDIFLNNGDDIFNDGGGAYTGVSGGSGFDTANFNGAGRTIDGSGGAGDEFRGFEVFNFNSGDHRLLGDHLGLSEVNFLSGQNSLSGALDAATASIAAGATLVASDGSFIDGLLINNGVLDIGGAGADTLIADQYTQAADAVLRFNVVDGVGDSLIVGGDVALAGELAITGATGLLPGRNRFTVIDGRGALTGAFDVVSNGTLLQQTIEYDRTSADVDVIFTLNSASTIVGLTQNQKNVGDNLVGLLSEPDLDDSLADFVFAVARLDGAADVQAALNELHPEGLDMGLKFLGASQQSFLDTVIDQAGDTLFQQTEPVRVASLNGTPATRRDRGGRTYWGVFRGGSLNQNETAEHIGFGGESYEYLAGISGFGSGATSFGLAGGFSSYLGSSAGSLGDEIDAHAYRFAATVSTDLRESAFGASARTDTVLSVAFGAGDIETVQIDPMSGDTTSLSGEADYSMISWRTRVSVDGFNGRALPVTPFVQLGMDRYQQDATAIGDADNPAALEINELDNLRVAVGGGARFEHQWREDMRVAVKAAAVQYFGDTQNTFTSRFAAAPVGAAHFETIGEAVERQIRLDANVIYAHKSGFTFTAGAFGETGDLEIYGGKVGIIGGF